MLKSRGYLAFFVGLCLTAATCQIVVTAQRHQIRANFERDAEKVRRDTEVRLQTYFDVLLGLKGVYAVDDRMDRQRFQRYVSELQLDQRYPGFQAIQFVRRVPGEQLASFSRNVQQGGYPAFQVHP
ncbi:MAG: CHASE domain-containing protein, partial [Burkholderiaceae bacterium]|nr:CHASE domain-containing protein [Burkholderiaceae bacterium]